MNVARDICCRQHLEILPWNFNTIATVFKKDNAEITARYKPHMLSSTPVSLTESEGPTGVNSQRKVDAAGGRHSAVVESAGEVWYVESADGGTTWSPELRLSDNGYRPSLAHEYASFITSYAPEFHLAWRTAEDILYEKLKVCPVDEPYIHA
jgi:hypothetical protein